MKHKVLFNLKNKLTSKPTDNQQATIVMNLKTPLEVTVAELKDYIEQGYAYAPSEFKDNHNKGEKWISQSIFCLDFDSGIAPEEVLSDLLDKYGVKPNHMYSTFSDSPEKRKFRVIIALNDVITCNETRKIIQEGLIALFKDSNGEILADKACKNAGRYFLPGKKKIMFQDEELNSLDTILSLASSALVTKDGGRTRTINKSTYKKYETNQEQYRDFNYDLVYNRIQIFRDFVDGKHLKYDIIFPLATNMINIYGGEKWMKSKMNELNKAGLTRYNDVDFNTFAFAKRANYAPTRLENFSPYFEDAEYLNLIEASKFERGLITQIEEINLLTLQEAEMIFETEFQKALEAESGIFVLKIPTGLGKTNALKKLKDVTLALNTHKLKDELKQEMEHPYYETSELPNFSEDIKKEIEYLYSVGLHKKAVAKMFEIAKNKGNKYNLIDAASANQYVNSLNNASKTDKVIITTHQKALFSSFKHDTIIFDECPMKSLMTINNISMDDLFKIKNDEMLAPVYEFLNNLQAGILTDIPLFPVIDYDYMTKFIIENNIKSDLISLLDAEGVYKETKKDKDTDDDSEDTAIYYITKRELPKVNKVIILSATAPLFIYKKLFGDTITITDITDVEQTGQIIQNATHSYSKSSTLRRKDIISKEVDTLPVITFKTMKNFFKNAVQEMHFGNCAGYNSLKGKDIAVVGTYHIRNVAYFLYAKALGYKLKNSHSLMSYQEIEYNGYRFKFNTFDDEFLRNIQLCLIESEQTQAVGRSRTLRENSKVYLYSNFPSRQTTQFSSPFRKQLK